MPEHFSERTRQCLEMAGWQPSRRVDTAGYQEALRTLGYFVGKAAIDFLSSFGGLTIRYPHFRVPTREDQCHFNAERAAANAEPLRIAEYERVLRNRLTVIGEAFTEHFTLMMDEDGAVFAGFEDYLFKMGDSGNSALNSLCEGREGEEIDYTTSEPPLAHTSATLSAIALQSLSAGGWQAPQTPDLAGLEADLQTLPEPPPEAAIEFLREFHGVRMVCAPWIDQQAHGDLAPIMQNPPREVCKFTAGAARLLPTSHFVEYRRRIGQSVAVIGQLEKAGFVLLMTEDGRVLAGMRELPDILWLVGDSGYDAIDNLCIGAPRERFI